VTSRVPRVIVCDVNETLLDLGALDPHFKATFGDGRVLQEWFANVLLYSEVATLAGPYSDFASIGGAALDMVAGARGITLSSADRELADSLAEGFQELWRKAMKNLREIEVDPRGHKT